MQKMGVINLTPDSFHAPSRAQGREAILRRAEDLLERGCSILDLGAVSTRPGAEDVSEEEEWRRLEPALKPVADLLSATATADPGRAAACGESPLPPVSVDTVRSGIVRRVFDRIGPFIVNDISAGEDDPRMLAVVAELGLPFIAMHKRGNPRSMDGLTDYPEGVTEAVMQYFREFGAKASEAGIKDWILDPGFGFAKTSAQNWQLLNDLPRLKVFGRPLLAGVADKRFTKDPLFNGGDLQAAEKMATRSADILRIH